MLNTYNGLNSYASNGIAPQIPQGVAVIVSVAPSETSASINYSYGGSDATGFKLRVNGSIITDRGTTNPILLTGLTADTAYTAEVLPYNAVGDGLTWSDISNFRTDEIQIAEVYNFNSTISQLIENSGTLNKNNNYQHENNQTTELNGQANKNISVKSDIQQFIKLTSFFINTAEPLNNYQFRVDGQLATQSRNGDNIYQNRDQEFLTALTTGQSAADFSNAKYELFEQFAQTPFITKTLGDGIVVIGDEFKTTISKNELKKAGKFYHQFTVSNQLNQELPPIFSGSVKIKEVR